MRLKNPSQPLVFCFSGATPLCKAIQRLYDIYPAVLASLCLYGNEYYLAVYSSLKMRCKVVNTIYEYSCFLGVGSVMYSFFEEHGKRISHHAVSKLGGALSEN